MWRNKIRVALGLVALGLMGSLLLEAPARAQQLARVRQNIVGLWQTNLGSVNLKSDGTYEGEAIDYLTGRRQAFSGTYKYANNRLELGGETAWVEWHNENKITVTVVAGPYEDYPRWQVTYTRRR